jgi:two-component system, cell cycle response regulator
VVTSEARTILIVDNDPVQRKLLQQELKQLHAKILEANDGAEALRILAEHPADFITTDLDMPEVDGYELCRRIASDPQQAQVPMLMLSSHNDAHLRHEALKLGIIEYFTKPFRPGSLVELAAKHLTRIERNKRQRLCLLTASPDVSDIISGTLLRHGYTFLHFSHAQDAIIHLQHNPVDLVLLDFDLPSNEVCALLDSLKWGTASRPFIGLTTQRDQRCLMTPFLHGARDVLTLPVAPMELLVRLDHQLSRIAQEAELTQLATIDALTRQYNRAEITRHLSIEVQRCLRDEEPLGLLMLDIDHFKHVNDTYGHPFGDIVLREVAERVRSLLRPTDLVGRYGGEELLLVLPGATSPNLMTVAERIRKGIEELPLKAKRSVVKVTASLGGSSWKPAQLSLSSTFATLIEPADQALYVAKNSGRNRWVVS